MASSIKANISTLNAIPSAFISDDERNQWISLAQDGSEVYAYQSGDEWIIWDGTKPSYTEQRVFLKEGGTH